MSQRFIKECDVKKLMMMAVLASSVAGCESTVDKVTRLRREEEELRVLVMADNINDTAFRKKCDHLDTDLSQWDPSKSPPPPHSEAYMQCWAQWEKNFPDSVAAMPAIVKERQKRAARLLIVQNQLANIR